MWNLQTRCYASLARSRKLASWEPRKKLSDASGHSTSPFPTPFFFTATIWCHFVLQNHKPMCVVTVRNSNRYEPLHLWPLDSGLPQRPYVPGDGVVQLSTQSVHRQEYFTRVLTCRRHLHRHYADLRRHGIAQARRHSGAIHRSVPVCQPGPNIRRTAVDTFVRLLERTSV